MGLPDGTVVRTNKTYSTSDDGTSFFSFQSTSFNSFGDSKSDEEIDEAIDQDDEGAKDTVMNSLPRGFGSFPSIEVLDLSYNNLNENSLPSNFFIMATLRALYLSDNEFEQLNPEIKNLKNLRILALRDNELID